MGRGSQKPCRRRFSPPRGNSHRAVFSGGILCARYWASTSTAGSPCLCPRDSQTPLSRPPGGHRPPETMGSLNGNQHAAPGTRVPVALPSRLRHHRAASASRDARPVNLPRLTARVRVPPCARCPRPEGDQRALQSHPESPCPGGGRPHNPQDPAPTWGRAAAHPHGPAPCPRTAAPLPFLRSSPERVLLLRGRPGSVFNRSNYQKNALRNQPGSTGAVPSAVPAGRRLGKARPVMSATAHVPSDESHRPHCLSN